MTTGVRPQVRIGNWWLDSVGHWSGLKVTHRWPHGNWLVEWEMDVPHNYQHPALKVGRNGAPTIVEVWAGQRVWMGTLAEPNWEDLTFAADGLCRELDNAVALDPANKRITNPGGALYFANARGATRIGSLETFSDLTTSGESDRLNYVGPMFDAHTENAGTRWWVDANGTLWDDPDPTIPKWLATPGSGILGVAEDDYVTHWFMTYLSSTTGKFAHVSASDSTAGLKRREAMADLTKRGAITAAKAQQIADAVLARTKARTGWTNGVTLTADQITNIGGVGVDLSMPRAGHMVRLLALEDHRGMATSTDFVVGESIWDVDEGTITLNPVDMAATDLAHVVEEYGGEMTS